MRTHGSKHGTVKGRLEVPLLASRQRLRPSALSACGASNVRGNPANYEYSYPLSKAESTAGSRPRLPRWHCARFVRALLGQILIPTESESAQSKRARMAKGASGSQASTMVPRGGGSSTATAPPTAAGLRKRSSTFFLHHNKPHLYGTADVTYKLNNRCPDGC